MNTPTSLRVTESLRFLKPALPCLMLCQAVAGAVESHPQLRYHPDGEAIVSKNSPDSYNRPLYCNKVWPVIYAGDTPRLAGIDFNGRFGKLDMALKRQDQSVWLHEFSDRTARYYPGRMQWLLSDARFPGLEITLEVTTVDTGAGFVAKLSSSGAQAGDEVLWAYGGLIPGWGMDGLTQVNIPATDANSLYDVAARPDGFDIRLINPASHIDNPPPLRVIGRFSEPVQVKTVSAVMPSDPAALLTEASLPEHKAVCVTSPLNDSQPVILVVQVDCIMDRTYGLWDLWKGSDHLKPEELEHSNRKFDESLKRTPAAEFAAGWARAEQLGRTVTVQSPDPWLNAQVGASNSAMYGLFVSPTFMHGGSQWRAQMPGWRTIDGGTAYGWHELVKAQAEYYIGHQIRESDKTIFKATEDGSRQAPESRYFGKGRIDIDQEYYNFQTQFFDQIVRSWRFTNDKKLEAILLPALELHLERARECFDPDDDGLYESYINAWPTDTMGYNGGGTVEESSYCYYMHRAAADMCKNAGDESGVKRHTAQAEKINRALHDILWLDRKGHFASYIEQGGNKRVHEDAWLYSQYLPIDHGIAAPPEAMRILHYTEWGLERIPLPYGGELCHTSNWVPSIWSVRELFGGDIYHLALSYFQMGQADAGWKLLRGAAVESGFGDTVPKPAYDNTTNMLSPGGLSHPRGAIDFNDVTTMFCRTVVEGLFGYSPDYPNGQVLFRPSLPTAWDNGSIKTPDFELAFRREPAADHYQISVTQPAAMTLRLPIYARSLQGVTVNGKPVKAVVEPWYGYAMAVIQVPSGTRADVVLNVQDRQLPEAPAVVQSIAGEPLTLKAEAPIQELDDAQGAFEKQEIGKNSVTGISSDAEGHYLVMGLIKTEAPYWKVWRVEISNPALRSLQASKNLRTVPTGAEFEPVDMSAVFNGDIRTIFQQDYASPRPDTASIRMARNGYQAWTMVIWNSPIPVIGLENALITPPGFIGVWEAEDPTAFAFTEEFTLDVWLRPAAMPASGGRIVDRSTPGTLTGYMLDTYPGNSLRLLTSNGMLEVANALPAGVDTRVTAVYSADKRIMKLYKDGQLIGSRSDGEFPPLAVAESALRVGSDPTGANRFGGEIQRVRLIPRAWSDKEVAAAGSSPMQDDGTEWEMQDQAGGDLLPKVGTTSLVWRGDDPELEKPNSLVQDGRLVTEEGVSFAPTADGKNVAFTSLWDNWPARVSVPVNQSAEAIWLLVTGFTHPMQGRIANAVLCFRYADGVEERLELTPPFNFRSLCPWRSYDYNEERDGFALGDLPPLMTQLGTNCRAMVYGWRLRPGVKLQEVTLESLSQEVIIGLMGVSLQNPVKNQ